ncbi:threonine synthase [Coemansia sp. RSA 1813]|nr:threonine synthase [Coemansia sp. RSA 1646]KAJ1772310.1 threonine synthase [Coemansia sp. RSA 1843]KAJ2093250.1 threonine synthase [Coemansia sp. RSA 986]KAJ2217485.1 threonine synthase [Coemansia sp. RSA 487]KAJ2573503.1 threonine synthase [Coemansia sp. RSA 1813]
MKYRSTRGKASGQGFESVVLEGLASDGGLYIPERLPSLPADWQTAWAQLSFPQLATEIISLFVGDDMTHTEVEKLVTKSYSTFDTAQVTPLVDLDKATSTHILELFHGPTFAFKDVALQFLGNLFEFFLERRNAQKADGEATHRITVVGATSGDTGSAAIYGLRGKKNVSVFILHPKGRVSPIQEAQMTTVLDDNVHNVSLTGTFDDCQDIVKELFGRPAFKKDHSLGAINSINWARILAQITYYFYAYFTLVRQGVKDPKPVFVVPSGNFGDILAGYYAQSLGLPVGKLAIATNGNDILDRFLRSGKYEKNSDGDVLATPSPAMDILVSSNFERFLWYLALNNEVSENAASGSQASPEQAACEIIQNWMDQLKLKGSFAVSDKALQAARQIFWSGRCSDEDTYETIAKYYAKDNGASYLLDPHTAVGVYVAETLRADIDKLSGGNNNVHTICLSTAHPAKFSEAVLKAVNERGHHLDFQSILPPPFVGLLEKPKRCVECKNSADAVAKIIVNQAALDSK